MINLKIFMIKLKYNQKTISNDMKILTNKWERMTKFITLLKQLKKIKQKFTLIKRNYNKHGGKLQ